MKVCSVCQRCYEDDVLSCEKEKHRNSLEDERPGGREIIKGIRLDVLQKDDKISRTYSATNLPLNQPCLVKIITAENQQFLPEARLMAALNHPYLVRIDAAGVLESGEFYLVTEEPNGQTLRDFLSKMGAPSEVTAIQIARQAAEGLDALHAAGVTHRNINPENIILTSDADHRLLVKLQNIDFGGVNQEISNSAPALYRLKYFSPEQCDGQVVDAQTDIYSLGIVLYEMLAGHPPFYAVDADGLIDQQKNTPPPEIKISNFDIRALLTYTLMDSLQKIPRLRLKKASVFARQLRHIEQLVTHSPTPPPVMQAPVINQVAAAEPPKMPSLEAVSTTPGNALQPEENSASLPLPEISETVVEGIADEGVARPLEEPVVETLSVESEVNSQPEPVEELKVDEVLSVTAPVMIEWEQPEDIPSESDALAVQREEFGNAELTPPSIELEEEFQTVYEPEPDWEFEGEPEEMEHLSTSPASIFADYTEEEEDPRYRIPAINQTQMIGAGLIVLILVALSGIVLLLEPFQSVRIPEQTAAKIPAPEKVLPKPAEPEVPSTKEIDLTQTAEKPISRDETETETETVIPNYIAPEIKKQPPLVSSAFKHADRNPKVEKKTTENKTQPDKSNAGASASRTEVKPQKIASETIIVVGKQSPAVPKSNGLTRPRVVKLSKPSRLPF